MTDALAVPVEIIAELGQGFEGRLEQGRLLLRAAAAAGADAAKFQLVYADELATPDYQYYDLFRSLEMADAAWEELSAYARERHIDLHFDVFGARSLSLAERMGAQALKVHGTDIANVGLLTQIARSAVPKILLGAGGAFLPEIEQALELLKGKDIVILLGFQGYPTPNHANQIARISALSVRLSTRRPGITIGFADHASPTSHMAIALAATALGAGARTFEKHLTLGEVMKMEDYEAALNPDRFSDFVKAMRDCAEAYGQCRNVADFGMDAAEHTYRQMIRRHVVAHRAIEAGARIEPADLVLKRTSVVDHLTDLRQVYGATATRNIAANEPMSPADVSASGGAS